MVPAAGGWSSTHEILLHCQAGVTLREMGYLQFQTLSSRLIMFGWDIVIVSSSSCACCSANNAGDELNNEKVNTE